MVLFAFLLIVFAPCLLAFDLWKREEGDWGIPNDWKGMRPSGRMPLPLQAQEPERFIGAEFEIRRFAKGLSERRLLIQDAQDGPKVTISQLREAAAELVSLAGVVLARELAMVTALMVAGGKSIAAAAREACAWMAWHESRELMGAVWDEGPPAMEPVSVMAPPQMASRAA
jgi:hypothetical protein